MTKSDASAGIPPRAPEPREDGSRDLVITEALFLPVLDAPLRDFCEHVSLRQAEPSRWSKRFCSLLTEKAHELETLLDDHGARNNRRFSFLVELVACIRGFGAMAHTLHHIRIRFPKYQVRFSVEETESFQKELGEATAFVAGALRRLLRGLADELDGLGIDLHVRTLPRPVPEEQVRQHLPHDVGEEFDSDEGRVAAILTRYLSVADQAQRVMEVHPKGDARQLVKFVDQHYDETKARIFEGRVHNLQSAYDTHIKSTTVESENRSLRELRGHISLALHLLEVGTLLVHFFERHEKDIQHRPTSQKISSIVNREKVLRHAVLFCLVRASDLLLRARPVVVEYLPRLLEQSEIELEIPAGGMLHARPLSLIVSIVQHYGTTVEMILDQERAPANSIMGLIMAAGRHPDVRVVRFAGDRRPLEDLRRLFEAGLGEKGMDSLPDELDYLRAP